MAAEPARYAPHEEERVQDGVHGLGPHEVRALRVIKRDARAAAPHVARVRDVRGRVADVVVKEDVDGRGVSGVAQEELAGARPLVAAAPEVPVVAQRERGVGAAAAPPQPCLAGCAARAPPVSGRGAHVSERAHMWGRACGARLQGHAGAAAPSSGKRGSSIEISSWGGARRGSTARARRGGVGGAPETTGLGGAAGSRGGAPLEALDAMLAPWIAGLKGSESADSASKISAKPSASAPPHSWHVSSSRRLERRGAVSTRASTPSARSVSAAPMPELRVPAAPSPKCRREVQARARHGHTRAQARARRATGMIVLSTRSHQRRWS